LRPFVERGGSRGRFTITGENIQLPPNTALALGIAYHELATNAVKYGSLSNDVGCVLIHWVIEPSPEGDRLRLCWQECDGPLVKVPTRKGFGSRVIERGLAHELVAKVHIEYHQDGLVCSIDIPAPESRQTK
jgi:two-component sensor histidine kinase